MLVDSNDPSLIHGVSKQDPKDRAPGQCTEQINFQSEPVEGLIRRPGIKLRNTEAQLVDPANSVYVDFTAHAKQFCLIVEKSSGDVQCFNETDATSITVYREAGALPHLQGGISTWAKVGDYLALASDQVTVTTSTVAPGVLIKHYGNIEVRSGAYSARYTVKVRGVADFTYTTPDGTAAAHVAQAQPDNIAAQLVTLMAANATIASRYVLNLLGNTIAIIPLTPADEATLADIMVDDAFGNLRARYAHDVVRDTTLLPVWAPQGMGLTVGRGGQTAGDYYVYFQQDQAVPDNQPRSGRWLESVPYNTNLAGANTTWPPLALIVPSAGTFVCIIGTPTEIASRYSALGFGTLAALDWGRRRVGDSVSNPVPRFVGSKIKWLGVFQDRLTILADNTVSMSKTKDYLQFFRQTVVTLLDDDPCYVASTFGEASELLAAVPFDRNLLITALGQQYLLYGKTTITPKNISLLASSAFESSPVCPPLAHGNFAYFATASLKNADLQEIYTDGAFDTAVARSVSSHVDTYIPGDIDRLIGSTKAGMILAHSKSGVIYVYRYLFNDSERLLSSWSKFIVGGDTMICRAIRWDGTRIRTICSSGTDFFLGEMDLTKTGLSGMKDTVYPDHWFATAIALPHGSTVVITPTAEQIAALNAAGTARIIVSDDKNMELPYTRAGDTFTIRDVPTECTEIRIGTNCPAIWKPTMPLARDQDGKVIGTAQLVVLDMTITYTMGSEFTIEVDTKYGQHFEYEVSPRLAGTSGFLLGERPAGGGTYQFGVMSDQSASEATITVEGTSPLAITTLDWRGQLYKNGRRI